MLTNWTCVSGAHGPNIGFEMCAGKVATGVGNVRLDGCEIAQMSARRVADIGGLDLSGYPHLRFGTWKGAKLSERVAEN
jgi:hypothetical protein